jgi:hypothetical protein
VLLAPSRESGAHLTLPGRLGSGQRVVARRSCGIWLGRATCPVMKMPATTGVNYGAHAGNTKRVRSHWTALDWRVSSSSTVPKA